MTIRYSFCLKRRKQKKGQKKGARPLFLDFSYEKIDSILHWDASGCQKNQEDFLLGKHPFDSSVDLTPAILVGWMKIL